MFHHHHQRSPFGRAGQFLDRRRLTQLYNDTKLSYENARTASANAPFDNDPDVVSLKKEFQIQQDRLLAWGVYWADKQAGSSASAGEKGGQDVDIDKKVDQAGLGDVVASIMESIKSMLEESGRMSHPGRWRESQLMHSPLSGKLEGAGAIMKKLSPTPSKSERKEWKEYEVTTGQALLEKLKSNIDLLYDLIQEQKPEEDLPIEGKGKGLMMDIESKQPLSAKRKVTVDEMFNSLATNNDQANQELFKHPLYIDFARLEPMHDPNAAADPPSYEDVKENTAIQARSIYYFPSMQVHVLVDLVRARSVPLSSDEDDPYREIYELAGKMSGKGLLTWDGHLKLLGFTLAAASSRFGLVYALPAPNDPTALQQFQTLGTSIAATLEHDSSLPPFENKIRLAYNIALTATGFLAQNECHGQIRSSNIVFLRENDNPKLGSALRCPYLLQPVQKLVGESAVVKPISASLYHHPDADEVGYGVVPAYDVYSVGLVLLEIGLWRPLVSFWKEKYDRAIFAERLRKLYTPKLASKCGSRYMKLVQKCLDAPEALQDKPSPIDAAEYLLSVVEDMAKCCALDELGPPSELDIDVFEALIEEQRLANPEPEKTNVPAVPTPIQESVPQVQPTPIKKDSASSKIKQKPVEQLRKWPELDIPQEHLETWNTMLMPRLSKILQNALKDSMESCSVSLMMIGSTPEKAKTTICVQCRNTARVKETLCKRFKPKRGWGLVVCPGEVRRSGQIRRKKGAVAKRSGAGTVNSTASRPRKTREQHYQPRPGCGASIGAFKDEEHLPPVSFGGTILVDGEPFGMTVHHMLDSPSDSETESDYGEDEAAESGEVAVRSTAPRASARMAAMEADLRFMHSEDDLPTGLDDLEISDVSDSDDSDSGDSDASTIRPDYAIMDEDGNEFFFLDDDSEGSAPDLDDDFSDEEGDYEFDDTGSVGDKPGIAPYSLDDDDELCITQPAIDDVDEDFFPSVEDRDDDHLASHSFGFVHASSGIKRMIKNELKHEIDWALIRVNDERLSFTAATATLPGGVNPGRKSSSTSSKLRSRQKKITTEPVLTAVTPLLALPRLSVTSIGRTSGLKHGRISQAMSSVKFHGRTSFSQSFTVEGGFGVPGDSGAWVFSEERGELCGHVLAWGSGLKCAFMAPMEVIFEDLKATLEAEEIRLPGTTPAVAKTIPTTQPAGTTSTKARESSTPTLPTVTSRPGSVSGNELVGTPPKMQSRPGSSAGKDKEILTPGISPYRPEKASPKDLENALRSMRLDSTSQDKSTLRRDEESPSRPSSSSGSAVAQQPGQRSKDIYDLRRPAAVTAQPAAMTRAIPS